MRAVMISALLLAGCNKEPVPLPPTLEPPSPRVMAPPERLPVYKAGDDYHEENGRLRAQLARANSKTAALQAYIRRVTRKTP
jgi:hypothetical protein